MPFWHAQGEFFLYDVLEITLPTACRENPILKTKMSFLCLVLCQETFLWKALLDLCVSCMHIFMYSCNNTNYNKFIHINIHCVHRHQIQLLTLSVIKTFLSFAAHAVFHTLSSSGGSNSNVQKTLCIDVKSFHQYIRTERKLSVLSIPSNQVWLTTCNTNNKNIIQMY